MGQKITTFTQTMTHPVNVSFACEHCGEMNSFSMEIIGGGKTHGGKRNADGTYSLTPEGLAKIRAKAQIDLDRGVKNAELKIAKGHFSWIDAKKCPKCKHYQSWQTGRIWKNFLKVFFGAPFFVFLLAMYPLSIISSRDSNDYPQWVYIILGGLILVIMVGAMVNLFTSLVKRDRKNHNKPTVII